MNLKQFGELVKQKYQQYAQVPAEVVAQKVTEKFPEYKKSITSDISMMKEFPKRYGQQESMGYYLSGGTGNPARNVQQFLESKNLPGQVITGAIADQREQSPQYQTNLKMSQGQPLTQEEAGIAREQGVQFVAGMSNPLSKATQPTKGVEPLIEEARKYKSAEEFIANKLNGKPFNYSGETLGDGSKLTSRGMQIGNNKVRYQMFDQSDQILLPKIYIDEKGTGLGTDFINTLKEYSDATGKKLVIRNVENPKFFDKFSYLKNERGAYRYDPTDIYNQATKSK